MKRLMKSVNIEGVRNVITACKETHVSRLMYTSSVHAIKEEKTGKEISENSSFDPSYIKGAYAKTKAIATQLVLDAAKEGLDAVIVHPAGIIGPEDYAMSHMGHMIYNFLTGKLRTYTTGGYNFVDVRDVVKGIMQAQELGKSGECYILSGQYHSVKEMLNIMKDITKSTRRLVWVPNWLAYIVSPFVLFYYRIAKTKPLFTPYSLTTLMSNSNYSHKKAYTTFGYRVTSFKKTIEDTISWCINHYHLPINIKKKMSKRNTMKK
jgi:dihydroflavonol-4-reductase